MAHVKSILDIEESGSFTFAKIKQLCPMEGSFPEVNGVLHNLAQPRILSAVCARESYWRKNTVISPDLDTTQQIQMLESVV